jgi:hypothetical protein
VAPPDAEGDGDEAGVWVGEGVPDGGGTGDLPGLAGAGPEADGAADCGAGVAVATPGGVPADRCATAVAPGPGL